MPTPDPTRRARSSVWHIAESVSRSAHRTAGHAGCTRPAPSSTGPDLHSTVSVADQAPPARQPVARALGPAALSTDSAAVNDDLAPVIADRAPVIADSAALTSDRLALAPDPTVLATRLASRIAGSKRNGPARC